MIKRIAHVAVATNSISKTIEFYRQLGLNVEHEEIVSDQKVRVAIIPIGDSSLELIEPVAPDSPISKFLDGSRGGIHHVSLEVEDLETRLDELKAARIRLIDEKPRIGGEGKQIAFIHPASTGGVLIELTEAAKKTKGKT